MCFPMCVNSHVKGALINVRIVSRVEAKLSVPAAFSQALERSTTLESANAPSASSSTPSKCA